MLREITSHPSHKLYDDDTIHLLCANYWLLPIYQELLHTTTRYSEGERKRPCSGLAKILAHPKPVKTQAKHQNAHTKTVSDWIGGLCPADSLYVWFPAHWVPHLLLRLEAKEDEYRQRHVPWFDRALPDDELLEQQMKAKAGRKLQFGMRPYHGGNVRQLTCSIRADWLSLPVDSFRQQLQNVRKGVVTGVFQAKVASPWAETSAPRLFLPNGSTLDQWYEAVFGLPLSWPEITAMNPEYMHPVSPHCFHDLRKIFRVPGMWGKFVPNWGLLGEHLYNHGPSYYTEAELEEKLAPSKSRLPGEVIKDSRRPDWRTWAWATWKNNKEQMKKLRQEGTEIEFPKVASICQQVLAVARKDANEVELQYRKLVINNEDLPGRGKRQKKDIDPPAAGPIDPASSSGI